MACTRSSFIHSLHHHFCEDAMSWLPDRTEDPLSEYTLKHGIFHLLGEGRKEDAAERMLDMYFMAYFSISWETVIEPLSAFRIVGLEKMRESYLLLSEKLPDVQSATEEDGYAANELATFLEGAGLYDVGLRFSQWAYMSVYYSLGGSRS